MARERRKEGIYKLRSNVREIWAGNGVKFENAEDDESKPAPVFAPFEISKQAEDIHKYCCGAIIRQNRLKAVDYEVADAGTALPLENTWTKSLVREPFGGVQKGVLCLLEVDEVCLGGGGGRGELVRVIDRC